MNEREWTIAFILISLAVCLIIVSILPLIPVTKPVTFYNAEIGANYEEMRWGLEPPYWLIVNTSEGQFVVTDNFFTIKNFRGGGANCDFRMCFGSPNDYHITLHKTLFGAYDTFNGMKRVTVGQ